VIGLFVQLRRGPEHHTNFFPLHLSGAGIGGHCRGQQASSISTDYVTILGDSSVTARHKNWVID